MGHNYNGHNYIGRISLVVPAAAFPAVTTAASDVAEERQPVQAAPETSVPPGRFGRRLDGTFKKGCGARLKGRLKGRRTLVAASDAEQSVGIHRTLDGGFGERLKRQTDGRCYICHKSRWNVDGMFGGRFHGRFMEGWIEGLIKKPHRNLPSDASFPD